MISLKALGALLMYPQPELIEALPEIGAVLEAEKALSREDKAQLAGLIAELRGAELLDAQERYVELFDRGRATSLHLFEHVHGDSRSRGQAMVDLRAMYERAGLRLSANELPDYLPAVLEYLSLRPLAEVRDMLRDCAHILRAVGDALAGRESRYSAVFGALLSVAGEEGLSRIPEPCRSPEEERRALDEEWIDKPVLFGLGAGDARPAAQVVKFVKRTP
jgi:nitrate reductase delta subunit